MGHQCLRWGVPRETRPSMVQARGSRRAGLQFNSGGLGDPRLLTAVCPSPSVSPAVTGSGQQRGFRAGRIKHQLLGGLLVRVSLWGCCHGWVREQPPSSLFGMSHIGCEARSPSSHVCAPRGPPQSQDPQVCSGEPPLPWRSCCLPLPPMQPSPARHTQLFNFTLARKNRAHVSQQMCRDWAGRGGGDGPCHYPFSGRNK